MASKTILYRNYVTDRIDGTIENINIIGLYLIFSKRRLDPYEVTVWLELQNTV